jgi:hypothetical protein
MPDAVNELLLAEMQMLRADFNNFARNTGERISSLETDMHDLKGNGQPGRVGLLERSVAKLSQRMWWAIGVAAGGSGVISALAWVVSEARK